jgi:hypothetical protein
MRKMVLLALVGGACGAGIGYARSQQREAVEGSNEIAATAAGGAALGLGFGWMLDRRRRKRAAKKRSPIGAALTAGGIVEAARAAIPVLEHAADLARDRASRAADAAKPAVEKVAEVAKPAVERVAEVAKERTRDTTHRVAEKARTIDLSDGRVREAITVLT